MPRQCIVFRTPSSWHRCRERNTEHQPTMKSENTPNNTAGSDCHERLISGSLLDQAELMAKMIELLAECIYEAKGEFLGIQGESQFCDGCHAFGRAQNWQQKWHGGDRAIEPALGALHEWRRMRGQQILSANA
jgi:hypothetical protein